jgi:hypothetical protein
MNLSSMLSIQMTNIGKVVLTVTFSKTKMKIVMLMAFKKSN